MCMCLFIYLFVCNIFLVFLLVCLAFMIPIFSLSDFLLGSQFNESIKRTHKIQLHKHTRARASERAGARTHVPSLKIYTTNKHCLSRPPIRSSVCPQRTHNKNNSTEFTIKEATKSGKHIHTMIRSVFWSANACACDLIRINNLIHIINKWAIYARTNQNKTNQFQVKCMDC